MKAPYAILGICDIFEIRFKLEVWLRIKGLAQKHDLTYTWIVWLALFRLIKMQPKPITHNGLILALKNKYRKVPAGQLHRHLLCLYGDDAARPRLAAHQWGMTISRFVRLALELNLEDIAKELEEGHDVTKRGIKMFNGIGHRPRVDMEFHIKGIVFKPFQVLDYWPKRKIWTPARLRLLSRE